MDRKRFGQIERSYGTEVALNLLMVERNIRQAFFDVSEFRTRKDLEKYQKKYEKMISSLNLRVRFFERLGDHEYILDCLVYNTSVSINPDKLKSMMDHKKVGKILGFPCPRNLNGIENRNSFYYELQYHKKFAYLDDPEGGVEKYEMTGGIFAQEWIQIFAYNCPKSSQKYMEDMISKGELLKKALLSIKIDNILLRTVQIYYC